VVLERLTADRVFFTVKVVSAGIANELQDTNCLGGDFRAYAVSRQHGNRQTHGRSS
jgi:hypothetical protein